MYFMLNISFFAIVNFILNAEIPGESDYNELPNSVMQFMVVWRNCVGDPAAPSYQNWSKKLESNPNLSHFMISLLWIMWGVNIFLNAIITLNFMISVITKSHEDVQQHSVVYKYHDRLEQIELLFKRYAHIEQEKI